MEFGFDLMRWAAAGAKVAGEGLGARVSGLAPVSEWGLATHIPSAIGVQDWTTLVSQQWQAFRQGYRDFGGNPEWEEHFVNDVIPCESRGHGWSDTYLFYISKAQFHPDSWRQAAGISGLYDASLPYTVGANVAVWSNAISSPGSTAGWPYCWNVGTIPP